MRNPVFFQPSLDEATLETRNVADFDRVTLSVFRQKDIKIGIALPEKTRTLRFAQAVELLLSYNFTAPKVEG